MKRLLILVALSMGAYVFAQAAPQVATVAQANVASEPTGSTAGVPANIKGGDNKVWPIRTISVTAKRPDDAGVDDQDLMAVVFRAWKYTLNAKTVDGGSYLAWSRLPQLDLAFTSDAGIAVAGGGYNHVNNGITMFVNPGSATGGAVQSIMPISSRLTYTAHNAAVTDGGTPVIELIIEGTYAPSTVTY